MGEIVRFSIASESRALAVDHARIATGGPDTIIRVRAYDGTEVRELRGHSKTVHGLCFVGDSLVSAGDDGISWWDLETGKRETAKLAGARHVDARADALAVGFVERGKCSVAIFEGRKRVRTIGVPGAAHILSSLVLTEDGSRVFVPAVFGGMEVFETKTGVKGKKLAKNGYLSDVCGLARCPGNRLAVATAYGGVQLWDLERGKLLFGKQFTKASPYFDVTAVAASPDGAQLATTGPGKGRAGSVAFWSTKKGACEKEVMIERHFSVALAYVPDGTRVVSVGLSGDVVVLPITAKSVPAPKRKRADPAVLARAGDLDALRALADDGDGDALAYRWLCVAADLGHRKAAAMLDDLLETSSLRYDDDQTVRCAVHYELGLEYLAAKDGKLSTKHLALAKELGATLDAAGRKLRGKLGKAEAAVLDKVFSSKR